jgi:hypothetical protein
MLTRDEAVRIIERNNVSPGAMPYPELVYASATVWQDEQRRKQRSSDTVLF